MVFVLVTLPTASNVRLWLNLVTVPPMLVRLRLLARALLSYPTLNWYTPLPGPMFPAVGLPIAPPSPVYDRLASTFCALWVCGVKVRPPNQPCAVYVWLTWSSVMATQRQWKLLHRVPFSSSC